MNITRACYHDERLYQQCIGKKRFALSADMLDPDMTEKLLTGMLNLITNKTILGKSP